MPPPKSYVLGDSEGELRRLADQYLRGSVDSRTEKPFLSNEWGIVTTEGDMR
jgi:hypothetical protein